MVKKEPVIIVMGCVIWALILFTTTIFQVLENQSGGCHWYHYRNTTAQYNDSLIICASNFRDLISCSASLVLGDGCQDSGSAYATNPTCVSCIVFYCIFALYTVIGGFFLGNFIRNKKKSGLYANLE